MGRLIATAWGLGTGVPSSEPARMRAEAPTTTAINKNAGAYEWRWASASREVEVEVEVGAEVAVVPRGCLTRRTVWACGMGRVRNCGTQGCLILSTRAYG